MSYLTIMSAMDVDEAEIIEDDDIRIMDFIIEFGIHNNMTATVCEALEQIQNKQLMELRPCTLKAMIIFYAKTIIFMNERDKLHDGLRCLQLLFDNIENNKKVNKAWQALQRGMKYQIVLYNLEINGAHHALMIIDNYFPQTMVDNKDIKLRNILINCCNNCLNKKRYNFTPWKKFKNWTESSFKILLNGCGESIIEQIAKSRMIYNKTQNQ